MNYFSHSYYQGDDYAREDYQYGESDVANATRITENFNYYLDGSTMLITGIDIRTEINAYDAQTRKDFDHYYVYKDEDATFADERKGKFYYSDPDAQHIGLSIQRKSLSSHRHMAMNTQRSLLILTIILRCAIQASTMKIFSPHVTA